MTKREAERALRQAGWCRDDRHDHREWWKPNVLIELRLDGHSLDPGRMSVHGRPWLKLCDVKVFTELLRVLDALRVQPKGRIKP